MFARVMLVQAASRQAARLRKIPLPACVARHFTKADLAFIAAAYAIPLPGTALVAALLVGARHGGRHLLQRRQHRRSPVMDDPCPDAL